MTTTYEEEITSDLAEEIIGYRPTESWQHYKLIINEYEISVLGYNDDGSNLAYEIPERDLSQQGYGDSAFSSDEFARAGGNSIEYRKYSRLGRLLGVIPLVLLLGSIIAVVVIVRL